MLNTELPECIYLAGVVEVGIGPRNNKDILIDHMSGICPSAYSRSIIAITRWIRVTITLII